MSADSTVDSTFYLLSVGLLRRGFHLPNMDSILFCQLHLTDSAEQLGWNRTEKVGASCIVNVSSIHSSQWCAHIGCFHVSDMEAANVLTGLHFPYHVSFDTNMRIEACIVGMRGVAPCQRRAVHVLSCQWRPVLFYYLGMLWCKRAPSANLTKRLCSRALEHARRIFSLVDIMKEDPWDISY